jgi:Uma2 family endonuclease
MDRFLTWEDKQEGKHEFDGRRVITMTGGSLGHQRIVFNLMVALMALVDAKGLNAVHEMRIQMGSKIRYPDACVFSKPFDQTVLTLTDAVAIFEVLSDDTATTDRVDKLLDYGTLPSLRCYVLLEQTAIAATVYHRKPGGPWIARAHTGSAIVLPSPDITLSMQDLYIDIDGVERRYRACWLPRTRQGPPLLGHIGLGNRCGALPRLQIFRRPAQGPPEIVRGGA